MNKVKNAIGTIDPTAKAIAFGELVLTFTTDYELRWNDKGSGAREDGAFWHPIAPKGFSALGSIGVDNYTDINSITDFPEGMASICVKDNSINPDNPATQPPVDYTIIWTDKGSGAGMNGSCWRPIPPAGYVALGDVFVSDYDEPSKTDVVCIREDLTYMAVVGAQIYEDKGSGASDDFSAWEIDTPATFDDNATGTFAPNTIVGAPNYDEPDGAPVVYVLNLLLPVEEAGDPKQPSLNSFNAPPSKIDNIIDRTVYLPFTAFVDDQYTVRYKVENSPFYRVEREISYYRELFLSNKDGSRPQTTSESIKTGFSQEVSNTFEVKTGISVTSEAGVTIGPLSSKVSVTFSLEMGFSHSEVTTQFVENTIERSLTVPAGKAGVQWALSYDLSVKRADNSFLPAQLSFQEDVFVSSEYPH